MGLVRLVVSSLQTRNVQRLTSTYLTLSLADIATSAGLAGPAEAESHVLR
jgi:COP9 signalosome complex subunit 3